ncbi:MAG: chemotaxis protein CheB [Gemmatimonadales bacterium]
MDAILLELREVDRGELAAIRELTATAPCPIIVLTPAAASGWESSRVFAALSSGAFDAAPVPRIVGTGRILGGEGLHVRLETAARLLRATTQPPAPPDPQRGREIAILPQSGPLVAIGASAGGPGALAAILTRLPTSFPGAIVVVQHIEERFAAGLVMWLAGRSALPVRAAVDWDCPTPGTVLVAASNDHLVLAASGRLEHLAARAETSHRPSIDVFFRSVAAHWHARQIGVLLTGMGSDGALGLLAMRGAGAATLAEAKETCIVYGMPKVAAELGAATEITRLENIPDRLMSLCADSSSQGKASHV